MKRKIYMCVKGSERKNIYSNVVFRPKQNSEMINIDKYSLSCYLFCHTEILFHKKRIFPKVSMCLQIIGLLGTHSYSEDIVANQSAFFIICPWLYCSNRTGGINGDIYYPRF